MFIINRCDFFYESFFDEIFRTRLRRRNEEDTKSPSTPTDNKMEVDVKIKKEIEIKVVEGLASEIETVTISDEEDGMFYSKKLNPVFELNHFSEGREVLSFNPRASTVLDDKGPTYTSVRELFGEDECVYVMDAKNAGNIGRFLNVSTDYFFIIIQGVWKIV